MKPQRPLTEEEKKEQIRAFLGQKRESYTQGILFNMCQGVAQIPTDAEALAMVDRAVAMADHLMEKLYQQE